MHFIYIRQFFLPLLLLFIVRTTPLLSEIPYTTVFQGFGEEKLKDNIQQNLSAVSQLRLLQEYPPTSTAALRRRAEADLPNLMQGLQAMGYYNPKISFHLETESQPAQVIVNVSPGVPFHLRSLKIIADKEHPTYLDLEEITPEDIQLEIGRTAYPYRILESENRLLSLIAQQGYPLVKISKREVFASKEDAVVDIVFTVDTGNQFRFGPITIEGLDNIDSSVIHKQILWNEGEIFDPRLKEKTQEEIENTGLFQSVIISHPEEDFEGDVLPILIEVREAKHRTVAFGFSYTTQLGPGGLFQWENRNMRNRGEKLSLETDINVVRQNGCISYTFFDFMRPQRNLLLVAEVERELTKGFTEKFIALSALIEQQVDNYFSYSYGLSFKELFSEDSDKNGTYTLVKTPIQLRWSNANNLLDPTWGLTFNYKMTPTQSLVNKSFHYLIQTLTTCSYLPLSSNERFVLAGKLTLGSILGAQKKEIPLPELFFAGTENCLRGYQFMTVSPLDREDKPSGGRSMIVSSLELRARWNKNWGNVIFYEVGDVANQQLPCLTGEIRQSVGGGFRYFTPVGPLRIDVAFPLNRRKGIDNKVQIYFSVGQAF